MGKNICDKVKQYWVLLLMLVLLGLAVVAATFLVRWYVGSIGNEFLESLTKNLEERSDFGTVGDFFGGLLGPTFSFLGLIMLLVTLWQNQVELRMTRDELSGSKEALQAQANAADKQRFENTFFALLEQHNVLLNLILTERLTYGSDSRPKTEVSIVNELFEKIFGEQTLSHGHGNELYSLQKAKEALLKSDPKINQYFRVLFQLLKFVKRLDVDGAGYATPDEKLYTNIVRSFLTRELYFLLALNASILSENDIYVSYHNLIVRYQFLEHMPIRLSLNIYGENIHLFNELINHYPAYAWGDNESYIPTKEKLTKYFLDWQNQ
ncbi:putative phage abortive infection protein [Hydromonas duriensis]|uniref:Putative phage abortive infection protein n=1 Tax=Hydromonas duriensis TaxID=1527608 RepID=A0A4V3DJV6_9BURK|nr:putative phage abortive infection protein [Hydromonas duriensis]TDR31365.1 putative phage abortive infection protein [Hydromonas duriensis]